jgi:secondary thiamine-phosphate synthase enzyme
MNQRLEVQIGRPGLHDITAQVAQIVRASGIEDGLCTVFIQHTSASVVITEGADPAVCRDLEAWSERVAPEGQGLYEHEEEGPDDMPSHIRASMFGSSVAVPVIEGRLALGTWQGIFLWEHRRYRSTRRVLVHVGP